MARRLTTKIPTVRTVAGIAAAVLACFALAACGGDGGGGSTIQVDGSSTVGPFMTAAAERFQSTNSDANVTVGVSGTGGGFERFCRGETDISDASRPIEADERATCEKKGIEYVELQVANDALSVVVNHGNDWAKCLTVSPLKRVWQPGSKIDNWNEIDPQFADEKLTLYGPGTDSGTFDYFTEQIVGEEGASRSDYQPSEDDNVLVQGVAGDSAGLGYFGFSYFEQNQDQLNLVSVDSGDGCVAPSAETIQSGDYAPLARPLFMYPSAKAIERPEVAGFMNFVVDNYSEIADAALIVPMDDTQAADARSALDEATG